ncbi:MAG: ATP-grasp domain-containing protein, partial [Acidobacteria bacterium]|nr:ATP-grasp domain-containing protein [Acidobacteriota bacterium]
MAGSLLILASKLGYQTRAFAEAAAELGLTVAYGTDRCHVLEDPWRDRALPLRFDDPEAASLEMVEFARNNPISGVVALGDRPVPAAARACSVLGLPFHSSAAADICRDKYKSRTVLQRAGMMVPHFFRVPLDAPFPATAPFAAPWVLKPLALSGSRGVIRANDEAEARRAFARIRALLRSPEVRALRETSNDFIQVEQYVEGVEVATEAVMEHGELKLLAVFDKPDPLTGPYFEETIYVTPSRLPDLDQGRLQEALRAAASALGLWHGPVHAEMRIAPGGGIFILEIAARCIGGLCARSLRFSHEADLPAGSRVSLESLLVRLALGHPVGSYQREPEAS